MASGSDREIPLPFKSTQGPQCSLYESLCGVNTVLPICCLDSHVGSDESILKAIETSSCSVNHLLSTEIFLRSLWKSCGQMYRPFRPCLPYRLEENRRSAPASPTRPSWKPNSTGRVYRRYAEHQLVIASFLWDRPLYFCTWNILLTAFILVLFFNIFYIFPCGDFPEMTKIGILIASLVEFVVQR